MILVHAGHRIDKTDSDKTSTDEGDTDKADQAVVRFPNSRVGSVYRRSYLYLLERRPDAVVSAAANGADLIVLRAADDLCIPYHVVLALPIDDFRRRSVDDRGSDWGQAFDRAISRATSVVTTADLVGLDDWYLRGNDLILDTAAEMATANATATATADGRVEALAIISSDPNAAGATGDFVAKATGRRWPVSTIDPLAD